jgi:phospholipase/carboxylesterase
MTQLKYNVREGASPQSPLLFLVHGRAGSISVMSTFARTVTEDWRLVFVEAPIADPVGGFSWWDVSDASGREQQKEDSRVLLEEFVASFAATHGLNPSTRVAYGFSQGAAILSLLLQRTPDLFDGVALLSGFVIPTEIGQYTALPRIFIAHGTEDTVIPYDRVEPGIERLREHGYSVEAVTEQVAHKVGIVGMRALKEWVGKFS